MTTDGVGISGMGKIPPAEIDIEEAVLGSIITESTLVGPAARIIRKPAVFYKEINQDVYAAILTLYERQEEIDFMSVAHEVEKSSKSKYDNIKAYIFDLCSKPYVGSSIEQKCFILFESSIKRYLITYAMKLQREAFEPSTDALKLLSDFHAHGDAMISQIQNLKEKSAMDHLKQVIDRMEEQQKSPGKLSGLPFGIDDVDRITGGLKKKHLIVLAARPGMGKTGVLTHIIRNLTVNLRIPVGWVSLEMGGDELMQRMLAAETGLSNSQLDREQTPTGWVKIHNSIGKFENLPLHIHDDPISLSELRMKAIEWKRKYDIQVLAVDYIQIMTLTNESDRVGSVTEITNGLKRLASELKIPVIALSQLSRKCEERKGLEKRPELGDLRDSGSIEQDANLVMFLFRPGYYNINYADGSVTERTLEIAIAKQRNAPVTKREDPIVVDYDLACNVINNFKWELENKYTGLSVSVLDNAQAPGF